MHREQTLQNNRTNASFRMWLRRVCLLLLFTNAAESIGPDGNVMRRESAAEEDYMQMNIKAWNRANLNVNNITDNTTLQNRNVMSPPPHTDKVLGNSNSPLLLPSFRVTGGTLASVVGSMIWQIFQKIAFGCQFVLLTMDRQRPLVVQIIRYTFMASQPLVVVDITLMPKATPGYLMKALSGGSTTTCRAMLIDITSSDDNSTLSRWHSALESSKVWLWPEAKVVIVGSKKKASAFLQQSAFRNTIQPLYIGLHETTLEAFSSTSQGLIEDQFLDQGYQDSIANGIAISNNQASSVEPLSVYTRCLYCSDGQTPVRRLFLWPLGSNMPPAFNTFRSTVDNLHGHLLLITSVPYFPYNTFQVSRNEPSGPVIHLDSLDKRSLETFSRHLNFTYEIRVPRDRLSGRQTEDGTWTGLMAEILYHQADFSTVTSVAEERLPIIDHESYCDSDHLLIVSLKPGFLPQYLAITRPFTMEVWMYILLSIILSGVTLWLLQRIWSYFSGMRGMNLTTSLFYSWAVILDEPSPKPPTSSASKMLAGWWLVACLVITTGFRSSLVAYLTVQSKTAPIDSLQDLVEQENWRWGTEPTLLRGVPLNFFKNSPDPAVKQIYKYMKVNTLNEGLVKILGGKYSLISSRNRIRQLIASDYTDNLRQNPYYISKMSYKVVADFGWSFRKGAPFRRSISQLMKRLNAAGIIDYWIQDIIKVRVRQTRKEAKHHLGTDSAPLAQRLDDDQVALQMSHMTGVFLVLLLGFCIASLTFLGENLTYNFYPGGEDLLTPSPHGM